MNLTKFYLQKQITGVNEGFLPGVLQLIVFHIEKKPRDCANFVPTAKKLRPILGNQCQLSIVVVRLEVFVTIRN